MTPATAVVVLVAWAVLVGVVTNVACWRYLHRTFPGPWNWRVLVWPDAYYRWLDRRDTP